jgi:hypothetical protein
VQQYIITDKSANIVYKDEKPSVNLDILDCPPKITAGRKLIGFDAHGVKLEFTPKLHVRSAFYESRI